MNIWLKSIILSIALVFGGFTSAYAMEQVNLNTATVAQLESVKGIGPKLAGAIAQYRKSHHGFKSVDELKDVKGIGDKKFAKIKGSFQLSPVKSSKP